MPFKIKQVGNSYTLTNKTTGKPVRVKYKSKDTAAAAGKRFIEYREKVPAVYNRRLSTVVPVKKAPRRRRGRY